MFLQQVNRPAHESMYNMFVFSSKFPLSLAFVRFRFLCHQQDPGSATVSLPAPGDDQVPIKDQAAVDSVLKFLCLW